MSSQSYRRPEFRLNLGYPEVSLARTGALAPIGVITPDSPHFIGELRRFGGVVARAHGRLVVVLPDDEVWRGRAVLPGGTRRARHRAALEAGADGFAMPHEAISVVLGTPGRDGTTPLAAVRRGTLTETQALLRHVGIRHAAIVGAGAFPGFATAPRLDVSPLRMPEIDLPDFALLSRLPQLAGALHLPRLTWPKQLPTLIWPPRDRRLLLSVGGAAALTLALLALPGEAPVRTPSAALPTLTAPVEVAAAIDLAPPVVESASPAAPPPLPELLRSERPMARPKTLAAAVPLQPIVTQATRNVPLVSPRRGAPPELRLTELTTARARIPDPSTDAPLRRPVAPASVESPAQAAATAEIRPMHRPKPAAPEPVEAPTPEPTATAAQVPAAKTVAATTRPLARPEVAPVAASVIPTLVVASLQPEQLIADSIAAAQATPATPAPMARPARLAAPAPKIAAKPLPKVVSPPQTAAPLPMPKLAAINPTPTPVPTRVVTAPVRRAAPAIAAPKVVTPAPVRKAVVQPAPAPVRKLTAAPAPVVRKVTVQPAPTPVRKTIAAKPIAAKPVAVAALPKPATERIGLSRGNVALLGVFGGADGRTALLRLPNGKVQKVSAGDRVQGMQVAAIGSDSVRVTGRGRDTLLKLPD